MNDDSILQFDNLQFELPHRRRETLGALFFAQPTLALFAVFFFMCATLWQMEDLNQGRTLRASRALFRARESPSKWTRKIIRNFDNRGNDLETSPRNEFCTLICVVV